MGEAGVTSDERGYEEGGERVEGGVISDRRGCEE